MRFQGFRRVVLAGLVMISGAQAMAAGDTTAALTAIADGAGVGNGDTSIKRYDARSFDVRTAARKLQAEVRGLDGCKFRISVGIHKNIEALADKDIETEEATAKALARLDRAGGLKMIIAALWDGKSGDGEYCSHYIFDIYTVDGNRLQLAYDHTD